MPTTEAGLAFCTNITMAIDGYSGVEHNLPITPLYDDVLKFFAASGTVSTPTLLVTYGGPWAENYYYTKENPNKDEKLRRFTPDDYLDSKTRRRGRGVACGDPDGRRRVGAVGGSRVAGAWQAGGSARAR